MLRDTNALVPWGGEGREGQRSGTEMENWKAAAAPSAAWGYWKAVEMATLAGEAAP